LALTDFSIKNYRSVRGAWLKLPRITVIVGANGSGKSNLYRAMYLVSATASGQLARSIAEEGGMSSIIWSGDYGSHDDYTVDLSVKFSDLQYDLTLGMMGPDYGLFATDLQVKRERVYAYKNGVKSRILNRGIASIEARDASGVMSDYTMRVAGNESILTGLREPYKYPGLSRLQQEFLGWRFYHHFRTDKDSPLRKPQFPVATAIMAHDGGDLIPAIATIKQWGNWDRFLESLDQAFPGCELQLSETHAGLRLGMRYPGLQRALDASELSDGTLQYLCLLCAFYSLQAPTLLVLNEPETSIHPDLLEPLARLVVGASKDSQIWITTHSTDLSDYILDLSGHSPLVIEKVAGETRLVGVKLGEHPDNHDDEDEEDVPDADAAGRGASSGKTNKSAKKQSENKNQKKGDTEPDPEAAAAAAKLASLRKKLDNKST
jgi:predicted ATPase